MRVSRIYFSDSELRCKGEVCKCGQVKLNTKFDAKLLQLRRNVNEPMTVNSCCRCKIHNDVVKGAKRSFHLCDNTGFKTDGTCAIDIKRKDDTYNIKLVLEAWELGFSIGVHPSFFHLDLRTEVIGKPQIVFSYGKTDPKDLAKWEKLVK